MIASGGIIERIVGTETDGIGILFSWVINEAQEIRVVGIHASDIPDLVTSGYEL